MVEVIRWTPFGPTLRCQGQDLCCGRQCEDYRLETNSAKLYFVSQSRWGKAPEHFYGGAGSKLS